MKQYLLKLSVATAFVLLSLISASAQKVGVVAGVNRLYSSEKFTLLPDSSPESGFYAGVLYDMPVTLDGLFLETGLKYHNLLNYNSNSVNFNGETVLSEKGSVTAHYLSAPLLAKYKLLLSDAFGIHFAAGPQFTYGVGGRIKGDVNVVGVKMSGSRDYFDGRKRFDTKLYLGAGFFYKDLELNVALQSGLLNQGKDGDKFFESELQFGLAYFF